MVSISIIMPLYNASKYLEECLQSVLNQTYGNYELICINDGSTDSTKDILTKFQKRDDRIKIISNSERSGAAFSRNKGMRIAEGKYLLFLDGDDIFNTKMLEKSYLTIEKYKTDIVMFACRHVHTENIYNKLKITYSQEYRDKFCKRKFTVYECEPYEFASWPLSPCNKLYRRSFVERNNLFFQDLSCANDIYFVYMALLLSSGIIVLEDDEVMIYFRDHCEVDRISYSRNPMCNFEALMHIGKDLVRRNKFKELSPYFYYRAFFSLKDALRARAFYFFLREKGISELCFLHPHCYKELDLYIRRKFDQFEKEEFESGWYRKESILSTYLYYSEERVLNLLKQLKKDHKKIAVWGSGKNGAVLLEFCKEHQLEVDAVIDVAKSRQGQELQGCIISAPEEILNQIQVIVISAYSIYDDVKNEVGGRNIDILDINQILRLY